MTRNIIVRRLVISLVIGLLFGLALSEFTFLFLGQTAREPETVQIIIPEGTAELVSRGEQPPSLPQDMIFVVGDLLVVINNDLVDHQLGPLWIPAGTSGQLILGKPESLAYECSFQPGNYIGLDVREPLTLYTRIYGILFAGIPLGLLIAVYAVILPVKNKNAPSKNV